MITDEEHAAVAHLVDALTFVGVRADLDDLHVLAADSGGIGIGGHLAGNDGFGG